MTRILFFFIFIFFPFHSSIADTELIISKIQSGWNEVKTMSGKFIQTDANGDLEIGNFYFSKPYQSKFIYTNKNEDIVTNENLLRIIDKEGFQIDSYSIGDNVLKKILSNNLDINKEFKINFAKENDLSYEIEALNKNKGSSSKIILTFTKDTLELKKWEIYDETNNKTVLEFTKIKKNIFISQNLFVVRYRSN